MKFHPSSKRYSKAFLIFVQKIVIDSVIKDIVKLKKFVRIIINF